MEQIKSGKGGVMVLPPPQQQKMDEMKMKDVQVQNWMPIDSQKDMRQMGGVAIKEFAPQQGKIAETKPMQMERGREEVKQGKIAEDKRGPMMIGGQITPQGISNIAQGKDVAFKTAGGGVGAVAYSK
jgi:hypothetical protein